MRNFRVIVRVVVLWITDSLGLLFIAYILPGVDIQNLVSAFWAVGMIALLNAIFWPLFIRFALPFTVLTVGLASAGFNTVIIILTARFVPGFIIMNTWLAVVVAVSLAVITTITHQLLAIDDVDTYYRNVIKRFVKRSVSNTKTNHPCILFIQIDGLAFDVLQRAIRNGEAPTMARWFNSGTHRLEKWECDWSSQTGATQAGLLMGSNDGIPAYRWYEKDSGNYRAFSHPADVALIEKRLSNNHGLLSLDGASRANLFSGNAKNTLLTLSSLTKRHGKTFGHDYYAYFANPYNLIRTIILVLADIWREIHEAADQYLRNVWPRLDNRGKTYPLIRSWTTVIQRDIIVQTLIADIFAGRSVVYADFDGYDRVAHRSGIERQESLKVLRDLDVRFARIEQAAKESPRPYNLVFLSDHGQTQGATFKQRVGFSLDDLVKGLCLDSDVSSQMETNESWGYFNAAVTEASNTGNFAGRTLKLATKSHRQKGSVTFGPEFMKQKEPFVLDDIKIMASGGLGLIYFTKYKKRLTLEEIDALYPGLINGLRIHEYIGFLLVDSKEFGGVVLGPKGVYFLKDDRFEGKNPLANFGPNAPRHIRRTNTFKYVADIMVNSFYDPQKEETAAFEELIGSHGGLGGNQSYPFILYPSSWYFPKKPVIGAENLHKVMKKWLADIGHGV